MNWQAFIVAELMVGGAIIIIWLLALRSTIENSKELRFYMGWAIGTTLWLAWYPLVGLSISSHENLTAYLVSFIPYLLFSCTFGAVFLSLCSYGVRWIILGDTSK